MPASQTPKVIAGELAIVARRYAQAVLDLAQESKQLEAVESDLMALEAAIEGNALFRKVATHPRLPASQVAQMIKALSDAVKFNSLTASFLTHIAGNHRLAQLSAILVSFKDLLAEQRGQHTAYVTSSVALSDAQITALSGQLGKLTGGTVHVVAQEDADLLGGMTIKMGSRLIDASVKGKLAQIERQLKTQQEAA